MDRRISDDVRADLINQPPEIRRQVLEAARHKTGPAAHDPERNPPPKPKPHEPFRPRQFPAVRIKQPAPDASTPRPVNWRGNYSDQSVPNPSRRSR